MTKPLLILDQHFRTVDELFSPNAFGALASLCQIEGGEDKPMDPARINALLEDAEFLIAAQPTLTANQITSAKKMRAIMEVSGAFHDGLDYDACFDAGIEVLSCAPGFRYSVAEMTLAMILAGARGLVAEHERFRDGTEGWLEDRPATDFSLYGQSVGFIGYGQIARETHRLLAPFMPKVSAYDPWLNGGQSDVTLCDLDDLVAASRVLVVTASPSAENKALLSKELIQKLPHGALVVVVSRAHCVDFDALMAEAETGRIRVATDVFPHEPIPPDDPLRRASNVILSPHRAAAVPGGRHPIGDMIVHDISAIIEGRPERQMKPADPDRVASLIGGQRQIQAVETVRS